MSDEIIKILDDLGRRFGIAIDWSSENVMPYLQDLMQRFIKYETLTSIVWMVVFIIFTAIMVTTVFALIKYQIGFNKKHHTSAYFDGLIWPSLVSIVLIFFIIICVIGIGCQINDLITCYTIPEKMIFNYILSYTSSV